MIQPIIRRILIEVSMEMGVADNFFSSSYVLLPLLPLIVCERGFLHVLSKVKKKKSTVKSQHSTAVGRYFIVLTSTYPFELSGCVACNNCHHIFNNLMIDKLKDYPYEWHTDTK